MRTALVSVIHENRAAIRGGAHYGRRVVIAGELMLRRAQAIHKGRVPEHEINIVCSRLGEDRSSPQTHVYYFPAEVTPLSRQAIPQSAVELRLHDCDNCPPSTTSSPGETRSRRAPGYVEVAVGECGLGLLQH
jgi:hypothetical protein